MKALSLTPGWAELVFLGEKNIECRTWKTDYRGELLICASSKKMSGTIDSHAVCVATLKDVVPFTKEHLEAAVMEELPYDPSYAWLLSDVRLIKPFPVKGKLHLYDVADELVHFPEEDLNKAEVLKKYYLPLVYFAKSDDESREIWKEILEEI